MPNVYQAPKCKFRQESENLSPEKVAVEQQKFLNE